MTEQANVIFIDNKEYKTEELSEEQKYCIEQLTECQAEAHRLKKAVDRIHIAQSHFNSMLRTSLGNSETTKAMENSKASWVGNINLSPLVGTTYTSISTPSMGFYIPSERGKITTNAT